MQSEIPEDVMDAAREAIKDASGGAVMVIARAIMAERSKNESAMTEYYNRAASFLEKVRDEIGFGYGEGDIERISEITTKRLVEWDRLDKEEVKRRAIPAGDQSLLGALERQADNMAFVINHMAMPDQWREKFMRELDEDRAALSSQEQAVAELDEKTIVRLAWENFNENDYGHLTYERAPPMFPQAKYDVPTYALSKFVKAVRVASPSKQEE